MGWIASRPREVRSSSKSTSSLTIRVCPTQTKDWPTTCFGAPHSGAPPTIPHTKESQLMMTICLIMVRHPPTRKSPLMPDVVRLLTEMGVKVDVIYPEEQLTN